MLVQTWFENIKCSSKAACKRVNLGRHIWFTLCFRHILKCLGSSSSLVPFPRVENRAGNRLSPLLCFANVCVSEIEIGLGCL